MNRWFRNVGIEAVVWFYVGQLFLSLNLPFPFLRDPFVQPKA